MSLCQQFPLNSNICCILAPQSNYFATMVYNSWGSGGIAFLTIPTVLTAIMLAMYAEEVYYIMLKGDSKELINSLLWLLGTYPAIMVIGTVALFIPRAVVYLSFIYNIFVAFAIYKYYYLIMIFAGGTDSFVEKSGSKLIGLNQCPCCCLCCLPHIYNSRRFTDFAKWLILQNAIFTPLYGALGVLLKADGKLYSTEGISASMYLSILNGIATLICIYGFKAISLLAKAIEGMEEVHAIKGKTLCMQLTMFITGFEGIIFNMLAQLDLFPCTPPLNFSSRRRVIFNYAVVLQMFFLGLMARYFFRRHEDIQRQATLNDELVQQACTGNMVFTAVDAYQHHSYNGTGETEITKTSMEVKGSQEEATSTSA